MTTAPTTVPAPRAGAQPVTHGVVPPLLTPLTPSGELDLPSMERLVAHLVEGGVDAIFALGSSSEVAFLTDPLRDAVLEAVVGQVGGQVPVIAGVIDMQTARVTEHIQRAEAIGVDGVVATAPFYAITGPTEVDAHFRALAAAATVPLWAYDIPVCVHTKLGLGQIMAWATDGVIAGVKDSSGDDVGFRRLVAANRAAGSPITVLTGHEIVVDGAYLAGADGCVPGLGNVDPAGYVRLHQAAVAGDWAQVRVEQDRLSNLFEIVFAAPSRVGPAAGIGAFKTALEVLGIFSSNAMSPPLVALDGAERDRIRDILHGVGLV